MLVGIFVNKLFTFSVSNLTVIQCGFLRERNVVFLSDMILLMVSTLFFSSWITVCICVFAVYWSLSCSVWLGVSGFHVFSVSVTVLRVLLMCLPICLLVDFQYFRVIKLTIPCYCPDLVSEPLGCCLKSTEFCPDFYHSLSIPSLCRVDPKITV